MKFGLFHTVQWPEGTSQPERFRESIEQAVHAERIGLDSVWLTEHHFARHGLTSDSLNILSYLASETERVRLGTAVAVLPFHHPLRLAESAAIVDILSDGRLDFGIGRGYQWSEFHGMGVPMEEGAARFTESIELIVRAWTSTEPFDHEGAFWQFEDVNPLPRPVQSPHPPIWVATNSEAGFQRCAENGWGVMLAQGSSLERVAEQVGRYREAVAAAGRPYDPSKLVLARALYVRPDDETAWSEVEEPYRAFQEQVRYLAAPPERRANATPFDTESLRTTALFGGPEFCAAMLSRIAEVGIEYVIFFVSLGGLRHDRILESLDLFAEEVAPRVAAQAGGMR